MNRIKEEHPIGSWTRMILGLFLSMGIACAPQEEIRIDLSGEWQFRMDPEDRGITEEWYRSDLPGRIVLPGSMAGNGLGEDVTMETRWTAQFTDPEWHLDPDYAPYHRPDSVRIPFWLQPQKKYTGAAWYHKRVRLSKQQSGKPARLTLERPHWQTRVWINGMEAGSRNSLATPHLYTLTGLLNEGDNLISIRVDNRIGEVDVGINSHSISDHTQSNWNGIAGKISLQLREMVYLDQIRIFPDVSGQSVSIVADIINTTGNTLQAEIPVSARLKSNGSQTEEIVFTKEILPGSNRIELTCPMGENVRLWDEFHPELYTLMMEVRTENGSDLQEADFGMREFRTSGTRFAINGDPVFLRGTLECAIFPETGYPPTDAEAWKQVYGAIKSHGLNHVRFHSWCPPEAAFTAADEMGIYLQVECSSWANQSTELGSGLPVDAYIWEESERIVAAYGNHPSFVMMAYGNEPGGPHHEEFLSDFVRHWKKTDNRRVYTSAAGWPLLRENQFHSTHRQVRIQGWGQELRSIINSQPPRSDYDWRDGIKDYEVPVVSHEIGQWCVYPDFDEMDRYTGVLQPRNFEIFRESLQAHGMGQLAGKFLMASGKLQALCYKADIEAALRTPGLGGFQLLDLHDFPGQGTALVGVLNAFWESKGYITPEEFRSFCSATVPLARLPRHIYREGDTLKASLEVSHFGEEPLSDAGCHWTLTGGGRQLASGKLEAGHIPRGSLTRLGEVSHVLENTGSPAMLQLTVRVDTFVNTWDIWVYPADHPPVPEEIRIVETLSPSTLDYLEGGGKVLLSLGKGRVAPDLGGEVGIGFSSIFWNTAWTRGQKPHTLGILCDPGHPALSDFPTDYHSGWQWWDAMTHADAIQLDDFPGPLEPIVQVIDDWVSNRKLALVFEAGVGEGKILVSGADLVHGLEGRTEANQLRTSLLNYMQSELFDPGVILEKEWLTRIEK